MFVLTPHILFGYTCFNVRPNILFQLLADQNYRWTLVVIIAVHSFSLQNILDCHILQYLSTLVYTIVKLSVGGVTVKVDFEREMARVHLPKKPNPEGTGRPGQGPGRPSQGARGSRQSTGSIRDAGQENEGGRANQNVRRISSVGEARQAEKRVSGS